jgi:hypothetical protein
LLLTASFTERRERAKAVALYGAPIPAAAVLTAHVHTALTAGSVLLAASMLAVLGLILPAHVRSRRPRRVAPQHGPGTVPEPARVIASV